MRVEEVLAWQRNTVRQGSVSSAARSYQIIRPTLQRLVDQGVVSPSETFDAVTQDRLGRHLLRETGYRAGDTSAAIGLLLGLFTVDLVLRGGHWIFSGSLSGTLGGFALRLLTVCLCLVVLRFPGALIGAVNDTARALAGQAGAGQGFSLASFAAGRSALAFSLLEGLFTHPRPIQVTLHLVSLALSITMAIQIAFIIFWSLNLFLAGAVGLFVMGYGGLKETTAAVHAYLRHLVGAGLSLLCTLLVIATVLDLAWDIRATGSIPVTALAILLADIIACLLIWLLPRSISRLAKGQAA